MAPHPLALALADVSLTPRDVVGHILAPRDDPSTDQNKCGPRPQSGDHGSPIAGNLTFQQLAKWIAIALTALTAINWFFLTWSHLHRYSAPHQQRQIIRIIFNNLFTCVIAMTSILYYPVSIYITPIADMYEAFCIAAFFLLMNDYVCPDRSNREAFYNELPFYDKKKNFIAGGSLLWWKYVWMMVMSYPFLATAVDIVEIVTQAFNRFCAASFSPEYAHIWVTVLGIFFIGNAIGHFIHYFFRCQRGGLVDKNHNVLAKFWSFKALIIIKFLQGITFSLIVKTNTSQTTGKMTYDDINFGIPNLLLCCESFIFSCIFLWSWSSKGYVAEKRKGTVRAIFDALVLLDIVVACVEAFQIFLSGQWRHVPKAPQQDKQSRRNKDSNVNVHLEPLREGRDRAWSGSSSDAGAHEHGRPTMQYQQQNGYMAATMQHYPPTMAQHSPPAYLDAPQEAFTHQGYSEQVRYSPGHSRNPSADGQRGQSPFSRPREIV